MLKLGALFIKWVAKQITYRSRLESKVDDIMRRTLRLEISEAMRRNDIKAVHELGDLYLGLGYNSYMRESLLAFYKKHPVNKKGKK